MILIVLLVCDIGCVQLKIFVIYFVLYLYIPVK